MKYFIVTAALIFSGSAHAVSDCAGRATDGSFVTVHIETSGPTAIASAGEVSIEKGGNKFGYHFKNAEIPQYFEFDDQTNGSATVGLSAFVGGDSPVSLRYVGSNYADMDLNAVLNDGKVKDVKGNWLRVWSGPGHAATDQYQLTEIACSVYSGI